MKKLARIRSTARYLPSRIMTNADFEKIVDTNNEWIVSRTGIEERRVAGEGEESSTMGALAAKEAISRADLSADAIDLILVATLTPDYIFPSTACLVQREIGAKNAAAFDLQAACSGFIYGMSLAKSYIESGMYKNILFVAAEKISAITDYTDRTTCILFGDGACASVVSGEGAGLAIEDVRIGSDGCQADILIQPGGGSRMPPTQKSLDERQHFIKMDGREVFKHAVTAWAISFAFPIRFMGILVKRVSLTLSERTSVISVSIKPGAMQLTQIPLEANSWAIAFVAPITPAFDAE
jgi:3-oxoacyl-[acyl-carrier-protein] synthase-3